MFSTLVYSIKFTKIDKNRIKQLQYGEIFFNFICKICIYYLFI